VDVKTENVPHARGSGLFQSHCADCHGADLKGGMAANLVDGKWETARTKTEIIKLIKDGNEDIGMPSFGDAITDDDIEHLHAYIKLSANSDAQTIIPATNAKLAESNLIHSQIWLDKLKAPWGLVFLDHKTALMTEKATGKLRVIIDGKLSPKAVIGIPKVNPKRQGGLLEVAIDPDYVTNKWVYLSFSHQLKNKRGYNMTKVVRGHIQDGHWKDEQTLFQAKPEHYLKTSHHYGSRITFDNDGHMFFSIGDRGKKDLAQDITRPNGKVHRLMRDGRIPKDNPFVDQPNAYPSIFVYGNRNPQGLVFGNGRLWETEHGPRGGDELNLLISGENYGWPIISYGRNYNGSVMTPYTHKEGLSQPISQWTPSIAVSSLEMITGEMFKAWNGYLLAGALKFKELRLIKISGGLYQSERIILKNKGRVRDITMGPDGAIYVVLNSPGQILRLTPGTEAGYK
ncbi:MAG: PQQ-dependent sugar dehydrogenase, partial [Robiginitomaculum sp.]|nr:PQQ-dependent sugar dehydrogenase [Robiginitomaculum sp.]